MKKDNPLRRRPGVKVKIGDQVFASIKAASRAFGYGDSYIFDRIKNNEGLMPDGTEIKILSEGEARPHTFTIKLTDEMSAYLERCATAMGVSKAWVFEKLYCYGKPHLDAELKIKE